MAGASFIFRLWPIEAIIHTHCASPPPASLRSLRKSGRTCRPSFTSPEIKAAVCSYPHPGSPESNYIERSQVDGHRLHIKRRQKASGLWEKCRPAVLTPGWRCALSLSLPPCCFLLWNEQMGNNPWVLWVKIGDHLEWRRNLPLAGMKPYRAFRHHSFWKMQGNKLINEQSCSMNLHSTIIPTSGGGGGAGGVQGQRNWASSSFLECGINTGLKTNGASLLHRALPSFLTKKKMSLFHTR